MQTKELLLTAKNGYKIFSREPCRNTCKYSITIIISSSDPSLISCNSFEDAFRA